MVPLAWLNLLRRRKSTHDAESLLLLLLPQSAYGLRTDNGLARTHYGCFMSGGSGNLLAAQLVDVCFIASTSPPCNLHPSLNCVS